MDVRRTASKLSSDEVALVLRRAADIEADAEPAAGAGGIDPAAVEEAAREVGMSPAAVRQALAELHAGALTASAGGRGRGRARVAPALPAHLAVEAQLVAADLATVHTTTADFLRREAFGVLRHHAGHAVYHRRTDIGARLRRLVHTGGSIQLSGVRTVTVAVTPLDAGAAPAGAPLPASGGSVRPDGPDGPRGRGGPGPTDPADLTATTADAATSERHLVRVEAEVTSNRLAARLRATATASLMGTAIAVAGLLAGGGLMAVAGGIAGGAVARLVLGRLLRRRRRDEVREVLAALLDAVEDPAARGRLAAGRPAWLQWSSGSALSRTSWRSARGWARASWSVREEGSPDAAHPPSPADGRAGPGHTRGR